jgi:hypothetical protein
MSHQVLKTQNTSTVESTLILGINPSVTLEEAVAKVEEKGCEVTSRLNSIHALVVLVPSRDQSDIWISRFEQEDWVMDASKDQVMAQIE